MILINKKIKNHYFHMIIAIKIYKFKNVIINVEYV